MRGSREDGPSNQSREVALAFSSWPGRCNLEPIRNYVVLFSQIIYILFKIRIGNIVWDEGLAHSVMLGSPRPGSDSPFMHEKRLRDGIKLCAGHECIRTISAPGG